ncbi:EAL domain-containing protein [Oxalobacteraceae bacterium CAVE-383]|nr:EAL domain-containing protein [Oxalobacteraceae bacterium CAVE-383]
MFKDGRGLSFGFASLCCVLLGVIWFTTITRIDIEKKLALESSIADSKNVAAIVSLNLDEVLARTLLYAKIGQSLLNGDPTAAAYLNPLASGDSAYLRFAVFDGAGKLVYSSARQLREPEFSRLIEVQHALGNPGMTIRPAEKNDRYSWRVPVLIPLKDREEHPVGYFAALLDLGYFLKTYKEVSVNSGNRIVILNRAGYQLAELSGNTLSGAGGSAADDAARRKYAALLSGTDAEGVLAISADLNCADNGGEGTIGALRKLEKYPLAVAVSREPAGIFGKLAHAQRQYFYQSAIVSIAAIFLTACLTVIARRRKKLYDRLSWSEREKSGLIDALEKEKARAYQMASHDYLTGIPNRMLFYEIAAKELSLARRSRRLYALFFMDLDKFKLINDNLGHAVGDLLLQAVSARLRTVLREYDLLARIGGDEFVILVSELASEKQVAEIAGKLVTAVCAPYPDLGGHEVHTAPSIGIALYPRDGQSIDDLMTNADSAMYSAKATGSGTYRFYDASLNESSARWVELLARFKQALREDEFCLHYQPKVDIESFEVVGVEALVRWHHPEHGLIYPGEFIGLAEEHDLILPLGHWVIETACRQLSHWRAMGIPPVPVAINVSAKQLRDNLLVETVLAALKHYALPAGLLEIEITESCIIDDVDVARTVLERLRSAGLKISLDDYGTGYSDLSHIKTLPIYAVKIDRSFVSDIRNDNNDAVIVASIISLAHNLHLKVIAEGVESKEQLTHLKVAGCDQVQGFYLQRPVSATEIERTLIQRRLPPI